MNLPFKQQLLQKEPANAKRRPHIGHTDEPSHTDELGMKSRYDGITKFVKNCSTPMTIAIQGDWGTGKTTAMQIIRNSLCETESDQMEQKDFQENYTIWFNTWQFSIFNGSSNLVFDLMCLMNQKLLQLAETLGLNEIDKNELKTAVDSSNALINYCRMAGRGTAAFVNALLDDVMPAKVLTNYLESHSKEKDGAADTTLQNVGMSQTEQILRLKESINFWIRKILQPETGQNKRLYIFIDDLDRLEPRVALELLEGMKNFTDYDNCVFILAVDQEVVNRGLKTKYGDDFGEEKSRNFFDKIIQVPLELPVHSYKIEQYVASLLGESTESVEKYAALLNDFEEKNPRTIKRSFNLLQLYQFINHTYENVSDMERLQSYAIVLLQLKFPDIYHMLTDCIPHNVDETTDYAEIWKRFEELTEDASDMTESLDMKSRKALTAVLDTFREGDTTACRKLVDILLLTREVLSSQEENNPRLSYARFLKKFYHDIDSSNAAELDFGKDQSWNVFNGSEKEIAKAKFPNQLTASDKTGKKKITLSWFEKMDQPYMSIYGIGSLTDALDEISEYFCEKGKTELTDPSRQFAYHSGTDRITVFINAGHGCYKVFRRLLENCKFL